MDKEYTIIIVSAILGAFVVAGVAMGAYAYDVTPTVDTHREAAREGTEEIQVYRFGDVKDSVVQYSDGTIVPSRTFSIEMLNHMTGEYEVIGYANMHGHKVKVDETDKFDISIGSTVRINPKY